MSEPDVVGYSAIAERTGRQRNTIHAWRVTYPDWPEPRGNLTSSAGRGSAPWWLWEDIEAFLDRHPTLREAV